jgi:hypothetical protein
MALFFECKHSCVRIVLDSADIVRDGDLATVMTRFRQTRERVFDGFGESNDVNQLRSVDISEMRAEIYSTDQLTSR